MQCAPRRWPRSPRSHSPSPRGLWRRRLRRRRRRRRRQTTTRRRRSTGRSRSVRAAATTSWPGPWSTSSRRRTCTPRTSRSRTARAAVAPPAGATCSASPARATASRRRRARSSPRRCRPTPAGARGLHARGSVRHRRRAVPGQGRQPGQDWDGWVDLAKSQERVVVGGIGTVNVDFIVTRCWPSRPATRSSTCPSTRRASSRPRCSPAPSTPWSPTRARSSARSSPATWPLLFTADERLEALPDVPTDQELGFEGIPSMPRGMILPPDAPAEAQEWWIETMKKVVETDEWKAYIEENYLAEDIRWGEDFRDVPRRDAGPVRDDLKERARCDLCSHERDHVRLGAAGRWRRPTGRTLFFARAAGRAGDLHPDGLRAGVAGPSPAGSARASSRGSSASWRSLIMLWALVRKPARRRVDDEDEVCAGEDEAGEADLGQHPVPLLLRRSSRRRRPARHVRLARRDRRRRASSCWRAVRCSTAGGT